MFSVHGLAARGLSAAVMALLPAFAIAQTVTTAWDLSPASDAVTAYEMCVGTRSLSCDDVRWSLPPTQNWFSFTLTRGVLHLITVRGVSGNGAGPYAPEIRVSTPRLSPIADRSDAVDAAVTIDPAVADPDGGGVAFTAFALPPGISIDGRSGRLTGRPTTAGTYRPTLTVSDAFGSDTQSFAWTVTTGGTGTGTGTATSPMTSVTLSFTPSSSQPVGTAIALSAQGQGGSGTPMYRFLVQPWGGQWQVVQDWSSSAAYTWRPATAGGYNLSAAGRMGSSGDGVSTNATFVATAGSDTGTSGATSPMTSVTLTFTPTTPQPVGASVVLSAQGQGGSGTPMYRFWMQPWGGDWQLLQDWSTADTFTWRPAVAGGYNLSAHGRTGTSGNGVGTNRTFEVTASGSGGTGGGGTTGTSTTISPMTGVDLSFTPTSSQPVGTSIVLSAQAQGGSGTAMYRFWAQPWGGQWQLLQDWSTSATYTWRPAAAGGYNLSVHGRRGTTGDGVGTSRTFEVTASGSGGSGGSGSPEGTTAPVTSVTLSFSPTAPQGAGNTVVIAAQAQGGSGTAMFRFWIQPWGGQWQLVQDWTTSATYSWQPPAAGGYNISVFARTGSSGDGVSASTNLEVRR